MLAKRALGLIVVVGLTSSLAGLSSFAAQTIGAPLRPQQNIRPQRQVPRRPLAGNQSVRAPAGIAARAPAAPFVLTPRQQAALDQILAAWERESAKIKTLKATFTRWEYDTVFNKTTKSEGVLQYAVPDKGLYRITASDGRPGEHWVCDGRTIFEFNAEKKQLIERPIPPGMQGQAITDGPLPFLFGAKADKLKQRYFMRVTTTAQDRAKGEIWIEAYPKYQRDAANFARAEILLLQRNFTMRAVKIILPNRKSHTVHTFDKPAINSPWRILAPDFAKPNTPGGWQRVIDHGQRPRP